MALKTRPMIHFFFFLVRESDLFPSKILQNGPIIRMTWPYMQNDVFSHHKKINFNSSVYNFQVYLSTSRLSHPRYFKIIKSWWGHFEKNPGRIVRGNQGETVTRTDWWWTGKTNLFLLSAIFTDISRRILRTQPSNSKSL